MIESTSDAVTRTSVFMFRSAVIVMAALVLTSPWAAAVAAAPATLPALLAVSIFSPERGWRFAASIVGGLTALEVGWVGAWAAGANMVVAVAAGFACGALVGFGIWHVGRRVEPASGRPEANTSA